MRITLREVKALIGPAEVEISAQRCCQAIRWAVKIRLGGGTGKT